MTQQQTFKILAIMNLFRLPVFAISVMFSDTSEAVTGLRRIQTFLVQPDAEARGQSASRKHNCLNGDDKNKQQGVSSGIAQPVIGRGDQTQHVIVQLEGASFSWNDPMICSHHQSPLRTRSSSFDCANDTALSHSPITPLDEARQHDVRRECSLELANRLSPMHSHDSDDNVLTDVSLSIRSGEMVAVIGAVGDGKSTLVGAILGHNICTAGSRKLVGNVAYVAQEHWIQNISLRENILFGSPMDEKRYNAVIEAAQLSADLKAFPDGDRTEIGERGINMSGGQKARCSIARALYAPDIDLYIFDDPLAAVDTHVCESIFKEAFVKLLRDKARLVVMSSNYHLLPHFDKVCVVENGRVVVYTSWNDLVVDYPQFTTTLRRASDDFPNDETESNVDDRISPFGPEAVVPSADEVIGSVLSTASMPTAVPPSTDRSTVNLRLTASSSPPLAAAVSTAKDATRLVEEEDRQRGVVNLSTYVQYFAAAFTADGTGRVGVGVAGIVALSLLFLTSQGLRVLSDLWLGVWAKDNAEEHPNHTNPYYMKWYLIIVGGAIALVFCRGYVFIISCVHSGRHMHTTMLTHLLQAPVNLYFDVIPLGMMVLVECILSTLLILFFCICGVMSGRILNRVSADTDKVDSQLPDFFLQSLQNLLHCMSIVLICIVSLPYFIIFLIPMTMTFTYVQNYFRKTSRETKRLESVSRSPLYVICSEVVSGIATIRAFSRQQEFRDKHRECMDEYCRHSFMYWMVARWIALRLEVLSNIVVLFVGVLAVVVVNMGGNVDGNLLGLALVYAVQLTGLLQWTVRTIISTEDSMTSVERIAAIQNIKQEKASVRDSDPPLGMWPTNGHVVIKNLCVRYRPDLPLVLQNVSIDIPGGCKVGIVGRTGSGKSSLVLALFRLVEPEDGSHISIDGVDICSLGLQCLRSHLTVIPQDPIMFSGTVRFNLDPFHSSTEAEIWEALERAQLKDDIIDKFPNKLDHIVRTCLHTDAYYPCVLSKCVQLVETNFSFVQISENGDNLSVGQKQLMCIARALLRKSKIILLDEATASIDSATDRMIQKTVRTEFHNCTVITIAHRIDTILDYDRILVLAGGRVAEYDTPQSLLGKDKGMFKSLVEKVHHSFMR